LSKGGNVSPPFGIFSLPQAGKGRWGGILTSLFQTAKLILIFKPWLILLPRGMGFEETTKRREGG
jgi:hypothetical protein